MNKIRVIRKQDCSQAASSVETAKSIKKPTKRELVEVVGGWITDWKERSEMETLRIQNECARFRLG